MAIGIARIIGNGNPEIYFYKEFKPKIPVDAEAVSIHSLCNEYLSGKSAFSEQDAIDINMILENCRGCFAHNSKFDRDVLNHQFELVNCSFLPFQQLQCT